MRLTLLIHVVVGGLALVFGYVALYARKGAPLHRQTGRLFVYAMITMGGLGASMAAVGGVAPATNIPAGILTSYLVVTALITVRPPNVRMRWLDYGLLLVALAVGLTSLAFGLEALASPDGKGRDGMPPFPFFMFGVVGTAAALLDIRMIRSKGLTGASRLARHLWRMCFALFIAALSFFLGQSDEFPEALRIMPLLVLPVLAVLITMVYWLWRVLRGRSLRGAGADYRRKLYLHAERAQSQ